MRRSILVLALAGASLLLALPAAAQADLDCDDFDSQAEAQAVYDADPSDPNDLDRDDDGQACEDFDGYSGAGVTTPNRIDTGGGGTADTGSSLPGVALAAAVCVGVAAAALRYRRS